ncbi:YifB family Mg chelatase-like AAA ATPase [Corynebacterium liangguodongii]|uniref:ATPase n=1 Tax=Corynebacterium liangguodongii TaxID=2079535 RepID=A0A2S0WEQ8_9CORY|nr:YifB family Mg chelatase-like AAA ATPase [Corynebacterium liangguodongii]AWB84251.1 ATPase [Corynebacterium liangguodongii]PWC00260.1 ATP-binding protein [Corynebacterium liangguodongii]
MALASTFAAAIDGVGAQVVRVEANVGPGLPGMHVVGLGDAAVKESRERIRTAVANATLPWPRTKIMVSLSPAHLPKSGSHFDLPIAIAVLASLEPRARAALEKTLLLGELGLGGALRRVEGILPMLAAPGFSTIIVPRANEAEAALVGRGRILVADSLVDVWSWALGTRELSPAAQKAPPQGRDLPDFRDVAGQKEAKHALEVAAAGGHHVFMIGPPGSGKSMLAERLPSILPPMTLEETVEATAIHSLAGVSAGEVVATRPFVSPHPSLTRAALIGGGSGHPRPGAVSLAHHGVLFLDEASEASASTLDALRIPLERRQVVLTRARREVVYPAGFQLILAANPCRCGAERADACRCTPSQRANHLRNISGPLRDRIDISLALASQGSAIGRGDAEPSETIADRVMEARERAAYRWSAAGAEEWVNARVPATLIRRAYPADDSAMALISAYLANGAITQRGVDRVLKLAWTLADLDGAARPDLGHVGAAAELRAPGLGEAAS